MIRIRRAHKSDAAARLVKPGGGLVYATCSVLPAENERQIEAFLERHPEFAAVPVADVWRDAMGDDPPPEIGGPYLRLSPLRHGTAGFFAATLLRHPDRSHPQDGEAEGPVLAIHRQKRSLDYATLRVASLGMTD